MEGGQGASRRDTKFRASPREHPRPAHRNAEAVYAQAQLNNLRTYDLKKYIQFSKQIEICRSNTRLPS
jgi:hypothetical protein